MTELKHGEVFAMEFAEGEVTNLWQVTACGDVFGCVHRWLAGWLVGCSLEVPRPFCCAGVLALEKLVPVPVCQVSLHVRRVRTVCAG